MPRRAIISVSLLLSLWAEIPLGAQGTITTVAGESWVFNGGGAAANAPLGRTLAVAVDPAGNAYITDKDNNIVVRVSPAGVLTVVAGTGTAGFHGDEGPATQALLYRPYGVAVDHSGNIYIADEGNNRIRKVDTAGRISTLAGGGASLGDGGPATAALLSAPCHLDLDAAGNLYVADRNNHRVRKITPAGVISTVAGSGTAGFWGDGGAATAAALDSPEGVALDELGNLYVADGRNGRVRRISSNGIIQTVAGNGSWTSSGDGGPAASAGLSPYDIAFDAAGNMYIAEQSGRVRQVTAGGVIRTVAGGSYGFSGDGGPATAAACRRVFGVAVDTAGNLYIADADNGRVRKVSGGTISTIAGNGLYKFAGDGGQASDALLNRPGAAAAGANGDIYIADTWNHRVRRIDPTGAIRTVAGNGQPGFAGDGGPAASASLSAPSHVAVDAAGNLYVADTLNNRIRKVNTAGLISTVAGGGLSLGDGGPATAAQLSQPMAVLPDAAGNLWIADTGNNRVRKVGPDGAITTFAGGGSELGDGGPAAAAGLYTPKGLALGLGGDLYIADTYNSRIRKVDGAGIITTVAGAGNFGASGDGADLGRPSQVVADGSGNLYVVDEALHCVRRVRPDGTISTVAGTCGSASFSGDGGPATAAGLDRPQGLAIDSTGDLYIADTYNDRIRKVTGPGTALPEPAVSPASRMAVTTLSSSHAKLSAAALPSPRIGSPDFSLAVSPASRSVPAGVSAAYSVSITSIDGFNAPVTLQWSGGGGAGSGTGPCPGTPILAGQTLNGSLAADCPSSQRPGRFARYYAFTATEGQQITIAMNAGGFYDSYLYLLGPTGSVLANDDDSGGTSNSLLTYTVQAASTYTIEATSYSVGVTGAFTVSLTFGLPAGITCTFTPNPATPGAATMVVSTTVSASAGTLNFAVTGSSGSLSHSAPASLTVTAPAAPASVTVASGNNQSGPAGAVLPNAVVVKVADASNNPLAGIKVSFATTGSLRGSVSPYSAITDSNGLAQAGWVLASLPGTNSLTATVSGLSPATFTATATAPVTGPGIITVAGSAWVFPASAVGGPAAGAPLGTVRGVASDSAGNVYIADDSHDMVFKVSAAGLLTVVAGTGIPGFSGDNGPATAAQLNNPTAVAVDAAGNVLIADSSNYRIRKVSTGGTITTVAGNGSYGFSGDGGPATAAQLYYPRGVAVDGSGNLYIGDGSNYRVRRVDTAGIISTFAGTGSYGFSGDDGPATNASLTYPYGVAVDPAGAVYIADFYNYRVRKVEANGIINTIAGNGARGFSGDGGPATNASLTYPYGVAVDAAGAVYIADCYNYRVRKVEANGIINTIAGAGSHAFSGDGGPATSASLNYAYGVAVGAAGAVYIADYYNYRVRKVEANGVISTLAGNGLFRFGGDGGPATNAQLSSPYGGASDGAGNFYIADQMNHRVRKVAADGTITTIAGTGAEGSSGDNGPAAAARLARPSAVALDGSGNLYIADTNNYRVRKLDLATGIITTAAYSGNTYDVAADAAGNVYYAGYSVVGKITPGGTISTVAGTGSYGFSGDGGPATNASLNYPHGVALGAAGAVYIADYYNNRVRKVDTNGVITTIAGNGNSSSSGDGGLAVLAGLSYPQGVWVDSAGNVYISTSGRIRMVTPGGIIATVAGTGSSGFSGDGGPAINAQLANPRGLWTDSAGSLFIADTDNHRFRKVSSWVAVPDFAVAVSPASVPVLAGRPGAYTVSITGSSGFNSAVNLSCGSASGLPAGVTCAFSPNPALPGNATLTVNTLATTPTGLSTFFVVASSGGIKHVASADLNVAGTAVPVGLTVVSGNTQSGPAGATLPNVLVVKVADSSGNPIAGIGVDFSGAAGSGTLTPSTGTTDSNGLARAGWILGTLPGAANTATAAVPGLSSVTFTATATAPVTGPGIITVAGSDWVFPASAIGGPASGAPLGTVRAVASDSTGNVYIADDSQHMVFKVSATGLLTVVAGTGVKGFSGDNGPATAAKLSSPSAVAVDSTGNVFIADTGNSRIRKVSAVGTITTVTSGLYSPRGVTVDAPGNLYVSSSSRVQRVDTSGAISTVAGTGSSGFSGDGGPATSAQLNSPSGLALDSAGKIYVADTGNDRARKIDSSSAITTVAGGGNVLYSGGAPATNTYLSDPYGVAVDSSGNLYIASTYNYRIHKVTTNGTLTTIAGGGTRGFSGDGGPATAAFLNYPYEVAVDAAGSVYIADYYNYRVRRVDANGVIGTLAGNGLFRFGGDSGPATSAQLSSPYGGASDGAGNSYIADNLNHRVRKVAADGTITTIAGTGAEGFSGDNGPATEARLARPSAVALDGSGNLYIADTNNSRVRKLNLATGVITTAASTSTLYDLAADAGGNVYYAGYSVVKKIAPDGTVSAVAGTGSSGFSGDGGPATAARLGYGANAIALDSTGNLYIADRSNYRVRKVDTSGVITTIAGNGNSSFSGDNGPALLAGLSYPQGVSVDSAGNVYISEGARIRRVTPGGIITTVAGTGSSGFSGDGGAAIAASLNNPQHLWTDSAGSLFIADTDNHRIRKVSNSIPINQPAPSATSLSPNSAWAGGKAVTLTVWGSNFVNVSVVRWNGSDRPTAYFGSYALTALISATDIAATGTAQVTVFTPAPGGGTSVALTFTISQQPVPTIYSFWPASMLAGGPGFTLTVEGYNFSDVSVVRWNGSDRPTAYDYSGRVTASITAADIASNGTAQVTVFNPAPGGGTSNAKAFTIGQQPVPTVTSLSPPAIQVSGPAFALTVRGTSFVNASVVRWNGSDRDTLYVSQSELTASIAAADIAAIGEAQVTVFNPTPGGGLSNALAFGITTPPSNDNFANAVVIATNTFTQTEDTRLATTESSDPFSTCGGSSRKNSVWFSFTPTSAGSLTANTQGSNYDTVLSIYTGSAGQLTQRACDDNGGGSLTSLISNFQVTAGTAYYLMVASYSSGGGQLQFSSSFVPVNPAPSVSSLSPSSAPAGGAGFTLTVTGTNFINGSVVRWNGADRATTFVSATQLTASVTAADIATAGTAQVTVFNPAPGGGTSSAVTFTVTAPNPAPAVTSLSPTSAVASSAAFNLTVNGTGFISGSVVRWNGGDRATTFVSATQLTASITAADIATAGTVPVTVFNPAPGGGTSNAATFMVTAPNPAPAITSLSPTSAVAGSAAFTLTVNGTGFISGSKVRWNSTDRTTSFVSATQLTASITAADIATAATTQVTVFNPAPGGGTSNALTFLIAAAGTYLVGDVFPVAASGGDLNGDGDTLDAGEFGDGTLTILDLIYTLRAVTSVPGYRPPACSDRFDAMDAFPRDTETTRGGDGILNTVDLIYTLRRVTNVDTSRPQRYTRGPACPAAAPGVVTMGRSPDGGRALATVDFGAAEWGADELIRTPVYLRAVDELALAGLSLALGVEGAPDKPQLRFVASGRAPAPSLVDGDIPGALALAWLAGFHAAAGERVLLGWVETAATIAGAPAFRLFGLDAATGDDRSQPLAMPRK